MPGKSLLAAPSQTSARDYVPCVDYSSYWFKMRLHPRTCTIGGVYGYQQIDLARMRWRSWGGATSYGRGITLNNGGIRGRIRVTLYRRKYRQDGLPGLAYARARFVSRVLGHTHRGVLRLRQHY